MLVVKARDSRAELSRDPQKLFLREAWHIDFPTHAAMRRGGGDGRQEEQSLKVTLVSRKGSLPTFNDQNALKFTG